MFQLLLDEADERARIVQPTSGTSPPVGHGGQGRMPRRSGSPRRGIFMKRGEGMYDKKGEVGSISEDN